MGTTFINIGKNGFWIRDSILELWLRLLSLHIEEPVKDEVKVYSIRDKWLLASKGYFTGCIPVALEEAVSTEEGRIVVLKAINSLLNSLHKIPEKLDKNTLNIIGIEGSIFLEDIDPSDLIEVGKAFTDLIEGKIKMTASDTTIMPGSKK
jgi:hypothetical protein